MDVKITRENFKPNEIQDFLQKFFNTKSQFLLEYRDGKILASNEINLIERYIVELRKYDAAFLHLGAAEEDGDLESRLCSAWRSVIYRKIGDPIEKRKYKAEAMSALAQNITAGQI